MVIGSVVLLGAGLASTIIGNEVVSDTMPLLGRVLVRVGVVALATGVALIVASLMVRALRAISRNRRP
jgi:hypothetical protein